MSAANQNQQHLTWAVGCRSEGGVAWVRSQKKQLLVGAADFCDVRLSEGSPWAAYYLHRFADVVEIWPLATQPEALRGCLATGKSFPCFGQKLSVEYPRNGQICRPPRSWPVLDFTFRDKVARVLVNQRVTTVGSDFPSVLRLPGTALAACHLILIWEDERLKIMAVPREGSSAQVQMLRLKLGQQVLFMDVGIAFLGVQASPAPPAPPPGGSVYHPSEPNPGGRELASKLQDALLSRQSRRDRTKWFVAVAFSALVSLLALWFGYQLFREVVPFL